jgi:hypothetical protein
MTATAQEASPGAGRQLWPLRGAAFGALVMLIIQFAIGIVVNLYETVPKADKGSGFLTAVGRALSGGPAGLAAHAGLGLLIFLAAIALLVRAIIAGQRVTIGLSAVGLLAIVTAAVNGARFVSDGGQASTSLTMALATAVAMLSYAACLLALSGRTDA